MHKREDLEGNMDMGALRPVYLHLQPSASVVFLALCYTSVPVYRTPPYSIELKSITPFCDPLEIVFFKGGPTYVQQCLQFVISNIYFFCLIHCIVCLINVYYFNLFFSLMITPCVLASFASLGP